MSSSETIFSATLSDGKTCKEIVDALATLLTEIHFAVSEKGIRLNQLDSSKAALVNLNLPASVFDSFSCAGEFFICMRMDDLLKVINRIGMDSIAFELGENDEMLTVKMAGKADRKFTIRLLDPPEESKRPNEPNFEITDTQATMSMTAFKNTIKDIAVFAGNIKMISTETLLTFKGEGDMGEVEVLFSPDESELALIDFAFGKDVNSMYSLGYLTTIAPGLSSDQVTLCFATNKPIMIKSAIATDGLLRFVIAPRIDKR